MNLQKSDCPVSHYPKYTKEIKDLEKDICGMREWDKLLLSTNPTLKKDMDK